jgi:hypothetical protein
MGLWVAPVICFAKGAAEANPAPLPCERIALLEVNVVKEPSGICYHSRRKTLFVVDDSGVVCEVGLDGEVVKWKPLRSADFEGITHDPSTGLLYIAIEGEESILEVDPETLKIQREFAVPRTFQGTTVMKERGQGIEAIVFVPNGTHPQGGTFFVANQSLNLKNTEDISAIFEVEVPLKRDATQPGSVRILRCLRPGVIDISGLYYDASRDILYAISDATDRIMAYTRKGELLQAWTLPGGDQEGITVDPDGVMYIAQDDGGVLKLKVDWQKMPMRP